VAAVASAAAAAAFPYLITNSGAELATTTDAPAIA